MARYATNEKHEKRELCSKCHLSPAGRNESKLCFRCLMNELERERPMRTA